MPLSIVTALVRNLVTLPGAVLRRRVAKDAEVLALRHENAVLRRQIARVSYEPADRIWFVVLSRLVPRERWRQVVVVTPTTLLAWHRNPCPQMDLQPASTPRQTLHRAHGQATHPAPDSGEPHLGPPAYTGRTRTPRIPVRPLHRLGDPADRRHRPRPAAVRPALASVPHSPDPRFPRGLPRPVRPWPPCRGPYRHPKLSPARMTFSASAALARNGS